MNQKIASELVDMAERIASTKTADRKGYWDLDKGMGRIITMDGVPSVMASAFGVFSDEWELTKIGKKLWGAYDGERLKLFTNSGDFEPFDDDAEVLLSDFD